VDRGDFGVAFLYLTPSGQRRIGHQRRISLISRRPNRALGSSTPLLFLIVLYVPILLIPLFSIERLDLRPLSAARLHHAVVSAN
jgi:hypothetical protein